jgi:riboflavin kinase/FMN adenylyltransferase
MEVFEHSGSSLSLPSGSVVTIGAYDGVHLGHRTLIDKVLENAEILGAKSGVVTFDRNPAAVVRPSSAPRVLTELDHKLELLAATGVDFTLVIRFDLHRSEESAEDFVREVLCSRLRARMVIVGHDFHFGHNRRGNVELLSAMGAELGFEVREMSAAAEPGGSAPVSSTRIRALLTAGQVAEAAALLGRDHEVRGRVMHGDQRGRLLGFPTANVGVALDVQLPADGVYAGWYERPDGSKHQAAISVGRRPTFYDAADAALLVEAFLLDFDDDLYDEAGHVRFTRYLRGQERFASVEGLISQLHLDVAQVREGL